MSTAPCAPIRAALLAAAAALVAATGAAAQTGGLVVVVSDAAGSPLAGATVTLSHETGSVKTTSAQTGADGSVGFPVLLAGGGYAIRVSVPGYNTIREESIRVPINDEVLLPVRMIEGFEDKVRIVARREVIDLETTEQTTKFSGDFISDLPVPGRFYQNVLTMAPGVQDSDGDGNPNVHGSRSRDFQAVVSGVSNVDPLTGQWMSNINPNSIEEIEVVTAGAGVEFGRAQGGFARIVQKQGSNKHEGVAEFYWRTSRIDGDGAGNFSNLPEPDFAWVQPALQLSGPLVRDRLWYRVSLENRDIERPVNVGSTLETVKLEERTRDLQITWQASPRNKIALNYRSDPRLWLNQGVSSTTRSDATYGREWNGKTTSLTWTAPYSPKVLIDSTVAWSDLNFREFPNTPGARNRCVVGLPWLEAAQCTDLDSGLVTGAYPLENDDHRQRLTVKTHATAYGRLGGSHQLKLGLQVEGERYFRNLLRRPSTTVEILGTAQAPYAQIVPTVSVPQSDDVRATGTNWGVFLEDQYKPVQNLTLTAGLRVDREELDAMGRQPFDARAELRGFIDAVSARLPPPDATSFDVDFADAVSAQYPTAFTLYENLDGFEREMEAILCAGVPEPGNCEVEVRVEDSLAQKLQRVRRADDQHITNTNLSPYLSLAWSPFGNGKTALKASAGRHYNNTPLIVPLQELEPTRVSVTYRQEQTQLSDGTLPVPRLQGSISPTFNVTTVDRSLSTPYQDELTFAVERELWAETALSLTWIRRRFKDQLQDININVDTGDHGRCLGSSVQPSWGSGAQLFDPVTGTSYVDTEPGPGDGLLDDCVGADGGGRDGLLDLYVQNPFWGDVLLVGNFNEIDYESWVLELVRRLYRGWELQASYVWSKAEGDGEDFFQDLGNDPGLRQSVFGSQSYDQRHVVKLNATTITPWGIRLGTALTWQSGLPYSIVVEQSARDLVPVWTDNFGLGTLRTRQVYPNRVRNSERNGSYWNVDLRIAKELALGRRVNLQVSAEVFNLLDDGTFEIYNTALQRGQRLNGTNEAIRRFGREWQLGAKVTF